MTSLNTAFNHASCFYMQKSQVGAGNMTVLANPFLIFFSVIILLIQALKIICSYKNVFYKPNIIFAKLLKWNFTMIMILFHLRLIYKHSKYNFFYLIIIFIFILLFIFFFLDKEYVLWQICGCPCFSMLSRLNFLLCSIV